MSELKSEWLVEDRPESALWQMSLATFDWFNEHIEAGHRVLDYGSGSGAGTARLRGSVTGIDVSKEALQYARQRYRGVEFLHTDGSIPFPDRSFDVVCSSQYVPIEYAKRAGSSKFHWLTDTRRYLLQVVRMVLMHEPIRFFGPLAGLVGIAGVGKLVYDLATKDFRVGTNTIVMLGVAFALAGIGLLADLLVQLNKRDYGVMPATRDT